MDTFQLAANVEDIPAGTARVVQVTGKPVAVFNVDGHFYAISNSCPHEGGPLAEGHLKGCIVTCPWHDLAFDLRTGHGTDGGGYCVGSYEVRVEGSKVLIGGRRKS
jgi:nitrite reductase (NADH) small subunit